MKINLDLPVRQMDGKAFQMIGPEGTPVDMPGTLREHLFSILGMSLRGDEGLDPQAKMRLYRLQQRTFLETGVASFSAEELATFKERANRMYPSAHLFGTLCDLLEREEKSASG